MTLENRKICFEIKEMHELYKIGKDLQIGLYQN